MTSEIRANTIKNRVGLGTVSFTNTGAIVSGIVTANSFSGPISGTTGTFSGNVDIDGDLDVDGHTNLDNLSVAGISTFGGSTQNTVQVSHISGYGIRVERGGRFLDFNGNWGNSGYGAVSASHGLRFISGTSSNIQFFNNTVEAVRIDENGKVGIGTDQFYDSTSKLEVRGRINTVGSASTGSINTGNGTVVNVGSLTPHNLQVMTGNSTRMRIDNGTGEALRIDSNGRLIIGHTGTYAVAGHYPALQLSGTTYNGATIGIINNANDATGAYIQLSKQRSGSPAGATIVQDDDLVGQITFTAADGTDLTSRIAEIKGMVDGTPGSNDTPGRLSFWTTADGAQSSSERLRITSSGKVLISNTLGLGGATSNPSGLLHCQASSGEGLVKVIGATNAVVQISGYNGDSTIQFGDSSSDTPGKINYDHGGDDFIFTAGGNARGRIYNDAGVTGIEHHQFHPFLIGYDAQTSSNVTMVPRFGGISCIPINADGDKAFMGYTTHWRHREYAGVYFWYGASGNTSGHTFDWDFTVWSATHNEGYSVGSQHTFTIASGSMSNGKMYRLNALSSWPTHHGAELVQFVIEYDEIQNGTSLHLSGLEIVEYTTP